MLSKCANPECSASFRYLHEGKVFRVDGDCRPNGAEQPRASRALLDSHKLIARRPTDRPEYFWLCSDCSGHLAVGTDHRGVVLVCTSRFSRRSFVAEAGAA